jgi:hypothetical protein
VELDLERDDGAAELHEKAGAAIAAAVQASEGRLAAVRLVVRGACRAHAAVCKDPARIVAQLRTDVIDRGGDAWLEKVELATSPETSVEQLREAKGLVADLLRRIEHARNDEDGAELELVARALDPIRKKVKSSVDLDLSSPEVLRSLLGQAEAILAQRLTEGEGT